MSTYAANRSLRIAPPTADRTVSPDFNRAVNLPCAYTDLATCPLPPAENRLPVAIEAGEKTPHAELIGHLVFNGADPCKADDRAPSACCR